MKNYRKTYLQNSKKNVKIDKEEMKVTEILKIIT